MTNEDYMREFFGEPISVYTDADAINDGTLVDITSLNLTFEDKPINRMTGNLFWSKRPDYPMNDEQLAALFAECEDSDDDPINFDMQAFARNITAKLTETSGEGRLRTIPPDMWLVENEVQGWTLMFPSDY
jgi:type I site-specific restriction endonuclease